MTRSHFSHPTASPSHTARCTSLTSSAFGIDVTPFGPGPIDLAAAVAVVDDDGERDHVHGAPVASLALEPVHAFDARAGQNPRVRLGIAHHLGWAVAVTSSPQHEVVDRRRIELIEPGLPTAPIHHEGGPHEMHRTGEPLDDEALAAMVTEVRSSVRRSTTDALDQIESEVPAPIESISLRSWPTDFPTDISVLRRVPYESRADSVMYLEILGALAVERGWTVHLYEAKTVEVEAAELLGDRTRDVLHGPRATLGPPWTTDHRMALAATVLAQSTSSRSSAPS